MAHLGAGLNHWYHMDMNYRGIINMLVMCGCIGQSGGGWSHYVGQEKLRPQSGWTPLAFGLDWGRPPRQHELDVRASTPIPTSGVTRRSTVTEILSPTAPEGSLGGDADRLQRARRTDGLAAVGAAVADQSARTCRSGRGAPGLEAKDYVAKRLKSGALQIVLRGSRQSEELATQPVRLALEPAGRIGQGPRVLPQAPARHQARRAWARISANTAAKAGGGDVARRRARRKARPAGHARLPDVDHLHVLGHRVCRRRRGTRRTISIRPTCTPSFTR